MTEIFTKIAITILVIVIGSAGLPITGGFSGIAMIGIILAIWGFGDILDEI